MSDKQLRDITQYLGSYEVGIPAEDTPIGSFGFAEAQQYAGHLIRFVVTAVEPDTYADGFNEDGTVMGALPTGGLLVTFLVYLDGVPLVGSKQGSISIELLRTLSEPVDVQDYVSKIQNLQRTLQHVFSTVDSIQSTVNVADRVLSDSIAIVDAISKLSLLSHTLMESVEIYDVSTRLLELDVRVLRESVDIDDALAFIVVKNRILSSLVDVEDSVTIASAEYTRALLSEVEVGDDILREAEIDRLLNSDGVDLIDSLSSGINVVERLLSESVDIQEELITANLLDRLLSDAVELTDEETYGLEALRSLVSSIEVIDEAGVEVERLRTLVDSVWLHDDTDRSLLLHHTMTDDAEVFDLTEGQWEIYGEAVYVEFSISLEKE